MALTIMKDQGGQQDKRRLAADRRPHNDPLGRFAGTRMDRLDHHRAEGPFERGEDVGQAVGAMDQGQLALGLERPGGTAHPVGKGHIAGQPGGALFVLRGAQGGGVVEEGRIEEDLVDLQ